MFRYLVLGLLRDGRPQHGYGLAKLYRDRTGIQLNTGNFYRELQKLAEAGLVRPVTNPDGSDPRRAPFEITAHGVAAFDTWLRAPAKARPEGYEDELSCRALFLADVPPPMAAEILERWQEAYWISGKILERAREAAVTGATGNGYGAHLALLLARRLKHLAADLEFLEELRAVEERLGAGAPPASKMPASTGPARSSRSRT